MTISYINWWFVLIFGLFTFICSGQENFTAYWQPQVAINYNVSNTYSHNFSLGHRAYLVDEGNTLFRGRQLDLVHFSKWGLSDNQSIAMGVQYRFRDIFDGKSNELRLTQQYNFTKRPLVVRFGHRFRAEQRILKELTVHRFRYRFAIDFPLKGEKLDVGEPFLATSMENLLSVGKGRSSQYDNRISGQIGWKFNKGLKVLFGIEYRLEDYTSQKTDNVLFLLSNIQLGL
ncbi:MULTISPECIES: DUF2490 domain-containing protein [Flavobacteriaceae]|uniref:DUF2490 domain-containing protein n=1 Tax=Flavobacteriaceae TaxID=49546 RepID=UPI0014917BF2|nr:MULTISPECIES: DUF2490 domain-containing protein [Allomuricauda]MDC6365436.1 DUF2490 domain-containing protein [Muricauda sp. AC10]